MASRKITLTFLDIGTARTTGWPLRYLAKQLGLWANCTDTFVSTWQAVQGAVQHEYGRAEDAGWVAIRRIPVLH